MQILRFVAAALLASVVASPQAQGDTPQAGPTYIVNVKTDHDDGVCGTTDCTLREAISAAAKDTVANTIQFAFNVRGMITLTNGELLVNDILTIQGPGAKLLSIDANSMSRVLDILGGTVTISGLTLTHGLVANAFPTAIVGGGCIFGEGQLILDSCAITDNTVQGLPAGAGNGDGSAFGGAIFTEQPFSIFNCTFSGNSVIGGDAASRTINVTGGAAGGGAVFVAPSNGFKFFRNCTFSGNTAIGGAGSTAGAGGPGGNGQGGAILFDGTTSIFECTISGNSATGGIGGGFGMFKAPDGNGEGGGVYQSGGSSPDRQVNVFGTIIAGNSVSTFGPDVFGTFVSDGSNIIGKADESLGFIAATDHTGTVAAPLDPGLDPAGLQDNGGPTQTIALLAGSVAIDNSDSQQSTGEDQRQYERNGAPDIGAFEFHGTIPGLLYNISTRGFVQTGNNVMIGGLIVTGAGPKKVILRALGPTLGQPPFNVPNALANPTLDLFQGSTLIMSNDNWGTAANKQAIIDTGMAPPNSSESAILINLNPGAYTAIVRGVNNTTGNALFEAYDLDDTAGSKFGNISTRGFVQTGNNVLIAGVIAHGAFQNVLIRALGPTLGQPPFNVPNSLQNPFLDLRDANGTRITFNDNWKSTQQTEIKNTGLPPPNDAEAAIVTTLQPGNYTAIVTGVNNTTGNALVEVYGLN